MAIKSRILAVLAAGALTLPLSGCSFHMLHVLIPDFVSHQIGGLEVYRLDDSTGLPVSTGRIDFIGQQTLPDGSETISYQMISPTGVVTQQITTQVEPDPSSSDGVEMYIVADPNQPAGWFKVSTFNVYGTSPLSTQQTYLN